MAAPTHGLQHGLTAGPEPIAYTLEGPPGAPVVMLSNSLGTTLDMWQQQAAALASRYRVLRYDTRGHGATAAANADQHGVAGGATLAQLGADVLRLLDSLAIDRVRFCGISMGGLIGLWLAIHAPGRLHGLVVANSAARIGSAQGWTDRATLVHQQGMDAVADGAAGRWFTSAFRAQAPQVVARYVDALRGCPPAGYAACCRALADADLRGQLARITAPTLLIAGLRDEVTTPADARFMLDHIAHASYAGIEAAHLSNLEAPQQFTDLLLAFLQ